MAFPARPMNGCGFSPVYSNATFLGRQFDRVVDLKCGFVRVDVQVDDIQGANYTGPVGKNATFNWTHVDQVLVACAARNLRWLPMFGYFPGWMNGNQDDKTGPVRDPANLYPDAAFAAWSLVDHCETSHPGLLYGFEDGNEVNTVQFWHKINAAGKAVLDPQGYFTHLRGVYRAIKTGVIGGISGAPIATLTPYPNITVLAGSMSAPANPTTDSEPREWVKNFPIYGAQNSFDAFAWHGYSWEYGPTYQATWNVFTEVQECRATAVAFGRPDALWWDTENGVSSRPDPTGTDPKTGSKNGGFDGTPGHTPGPGQSVTNSKEISYSLAATRITQIDAAGKAYKDTNNPTGTAQRWTGPRAWYGIESTIPSLSVGPSFDPTNPWNYNYGPFEYSATHQGAEKTPVGWPTVPSIRDAMRALATADTTAPIPVVQTPTSGTQKGTVVFAIAMHDVGGDDDSQLTLTSVVDTTARGTVAYVPAGIGFGYNFTVTVDTTALTNAFHAFHFTGTDTSDNAHTTTITLTVGNAAPTDLPPVIVSVSPADGAAVSDVQQLGAVITDDDDSTVSVQWWAGTPGPSGYGPIPIATGHQTAPNTYEGDWNTKIFGNGNEEVHVVATDSGGNVTVGP